MTRRMRFALAAATLLLSAASCAPNPLATLPRGAWTMVASGPTVRYLLLEGAEPVEAPEAAVARLEAFLADVGPDWYVPDELHYYAFPDRETLRRLTGWDATGRAVVDRDAVVSIYAADAHEVAHVLTVPPGRPLRVSSLWLEGIAMYYTWPEVFFPPAEAAGRPRRIGTWHGRSVHAWAQEALIADELPPLTSLALDNRTWRELPDGLTYPLSGSFTTFLLGPGHTDPERIARLRGFLDDANTARDLDEVLSAFAQHMGVPLVDAERAWHAFLREWDESALEYARADAAP